MNRLIKFRAWDGNNMIYPDDNSRVVLEFNKISGWNIIPNIPNYKGEYLCGESQDKTPDFVLMQYIGVKDQNEKEIYEGDIVNWLGIGYEVRYGYSEIAGYQVNACFYLNSLDGNTDSCIYTEHFYKNVFVKGNIYENHELLKSYKL